MSTYMDMNTLNTGRPADEAPRIITEYLTSEGLEYRDERGEMVWRKGTGALTSPQFIKTGILPDGVGRGPRRPARTALLGWHPLDRRCGRRRHRIRRCRRHRVTRLCHRV